ncbi:hypothetical protein [Soonwooa sp.]|uniref:hypothetical protein n=1 Tax=Soonwooa sp. TaxID=1938592 RepID=UPI00260C7C42|nr:hypothetical protein [Soonwooa sp.]
MRKITFLLFALLPYFIFSQQSFNELKCLKGNWEGSAEGQNIIVNILENESKLPLITFTNFQNAKFTVLEASVSESKRGEILLNVDKATLSYCEKCDFVYGKIKIIIKNKNTILISIKGVGPNVWTSYDQFEGMTDIENLKLSKKAKN